MTNAADWSIKEDEILINFVRPNEVLYDIKNVNYRQSQLKKELWCEVAEILNKTDTECYKRWCYVRDYYIRRRGKVARLGEAGRKRAKLLSFLDNFCWLQRNGPNRGSSNTREGDNGKEDNELYMIHVSEDTYDPLNEVGDCSADTFYKSNNSDEDCKNFDDKDTGLKKKIIWKQWHAQDQLNLYKDQDKPFNENDSNNSEEDSKNDGNINLKRKLNQVQQSTVYKQRNPSFRNDWDETDLFFSSIAKIVKKLPRYEQIELRMQIGTLVGNAELRCIGHSSSNTGSPQPRTSENECENNIAEDATKYLEIVGPSKSPI